jgi:hypothetical protein
MSCSAGTYTIGTNNSHTPPWSGTLVIATDGTATFTPSNGTSVSVVAQCGTENGVAWISFTDTSPNPAVHYKKAFWSQSAGDYQGACDNNRGGGVTGDTDDWTATPSQFPGPKTPSKPPKKKAVKKAAKNVTKVAAKAPAKKATKAPVQKAAKKAVKKAVKKAAKKRR